MRPRSAMFGFQEDAARRAAELRHLLLLLEPGLGKTVVTLTALLDLEAWPALVVAPAGVVETNVWGEEQRQWSHLQGVNVVRLAGKPQRRRDALDLFGHVEVVSYDNLLWLSEAVDLPARYRAVVYDEVDKMKHPSTKRFRRVRGLRVHERVPVVLGLTGTPVGNHLLDLWGEVFTVCGPGPLGPTFMPRMRDGKEIDPGFRKTWFEPVDYNERVWRLKCCPGCPPECDHLHHECHQRAVGQLGRLVAPHAYVRPSAVPTRAPPVRVALRRLPMPGEVEALSRKLSRELWAELPSGAELEALSASAVAMKLRQLAGGAVYFNPDPDAKMETEDRYAFEELHAAKLDALDDLLDELQGQPLLVYYWFRHEAVRIKRRLAGRAWADFTTQGAKATERWNRGELEVLLAHPQSAGHGLNLQAGGHHVCWYTLPWSHALLTQGHGRLARVGQRAPEVVSHWLLCGPVDEDVAAVLSNKGEAQEQLTRSARGDEE